MNHREKIDEKIKVNDYNLNHLLLALDQTKRIDAVAYCIGRSRAELEAILLRSVPALASLSIKDWREVIKQVDDMALYHLKGIITIYCHIDRLFLEAIGMPDELIKEAIEVASDEGYIHDQALNREYRSPSHTRIYELKLKALKHAGVSDDQRLVLENLFTMDT